MNLSFKDGKLRKATIHDVAEYNVNDCRHHGHPFVSITAIDDDGAGVSAFLDPEIAKRLSDELAALFAEPAQSGDPLEQAIDKAIGPPDELLATAATTPIDAVTAMMDGDRAKEEADAPY